MGQVDLAGKAGLVEGLASSPHHLSNEDSLPTPGVSTIIVDKVLDNLTLGRYLSLPISALALVLLTQEPWVLKKNGCKIFLSVCIFPYRQSRCSLSYLAQVVSWEQYRLWLCDQPTRESLEF